ncbi:retrovirus-related pol polyprotein from transposon TNT 1-94 [Tanacetum coccineum]
MDSIIPLGQKNTLAEYMILSGGDNRPPMLDNNLYDSWKSRMELYMQNREHGIMILESVENGPLIWPTVKENGVTRKKKYVELSAAKKIQTNCDMKAPNIILQDDLIIACLNKAMAFLTAVASSRVIVQQVQGKHGQSYSGIGYKSNATSFSGETMQADRQRVVKCYNCQGEGHMARQCTQPKRPKNVAWYKDKAMLVEAQEAGQILDEEQLAFLADPGVPDAVLMDNISNYGSDVILEVPHSETYLNDMENQSVHAMQDFEQTPIVDVTDNEITSDSNIIPYSQYLQETQQANVLDTNLQAQ